MKKKLAVSVSLVLALSIIAASYGLFFADITEKRYNKIMCYYIARGLTGNKDTFYDKITAIRDFVNENVQPIHGYPNRLDTLAIEKLTSGIGWCDQASRVFMQLGRSVGITSRLLFLRLESGSSPHSVVEALAPDGSWVVVDTLYKDTKANDPDYLAMYVNTPIYVTTKRGVEVDFLKFVPLRLIRPVASVISDRYINKTAQSIQNTYELKMLKARTYNLLGYHEKSEILYNEIIKDSDDLLLKRKAGFYRILLLKSRKRYKKARGYLTDIIKNDKANPYIVYLREHNT
jgi:hypothetical protein